MHLKPINKNASLTTEHKTHVELNEKETKNDKIYRHQKAPSLTGFFLQTLLSNMRLDLDFDILGRTLLKIWRHWALAQLFFSVLG